MKKILYSITFLCTQVLLGQGHWQQVWADEFSTAGAPDSSKWSYWEECGIYYNEAQHYVKNRLENSRVEDGNLLIQAQVKPKKQCGAFSSANIISKYLGDWQYGKFEIRAKVPGYMGSLPTISLKPTNLTEFPDEIFLLKNEGTYPNIAKFFVNTRANNSYTATENFDSVYVDDFSADFHTYTLEWNADSITMFLDGNKEFTYRKERGDYDQWPFYGPFNLSVKLALSGVDNIETEKMSNPFAIDYIRVYSWQTDEGPYEITLADSPNGEVTLSPDQLVFDADGKVTLQAQAKEGYDFIGWKSDFFSAENPLTLTMNRDLSITPIFRASGELVKNGNFEEDGRYWDFTAFGGSYGSFYTHDKEIDLNIYSNAPEAPWQVQLKNTGIKLFKDRIYKFAYEIESKDLMKITASVGLDFDPFTTFVANAEDGSAVPQKYEHIFSMDHDVPNARVAFDLAYAIGNVKISNVSLMDVTLTHVNDAPAHNDLQINYANKQLSITSPNEIASVEVFNTTGQILSLSKNIDLKQITVPVSETMFMVRIIDKQGNVYAKKMMGTVTE